jgi:hypothetical protein
MVKTEDVHILMHLFIIKPNLRLSSLNIQNYQGSKKLILFSDRSCESWVGNLGFGLGLHTHFLIWLAIVYSLAVWPQ